MDVPLGKEKADLALINATILNVYTGEYLDRQSVAIKGEWIAYVGGDQETRIGPNTRVIDARGKTVIPGLIDGHSHIADWMCSPSEFLGAAMAGGTTTIITEIIEPFPIAGYEGVVDFLASLRDQPIKVFATAPTVVSTSSRARGMPREILLKLLSRDDILGLGESYWQGVMQKPGEFLPLFKETLDVGKKLEGHSAGAKGERLMASPREHAFSEHSLKTVHLPRPLEPSDFLINAGGEASFVKVRVIDQATDLVTREHITSVPVRNGEIRSDVTKDLLKVAAVDRKFSPGKTFVGLVRGFGMKAGALASSGAWDTPDIIVVGQNDEDMALAVNRIRDLQGGALICAHGRILAEVPLPIFGLLSQIPMKTLAKTAEGITRASKDLGCPLEDPLRSLVMLTGAAIPFLRICEEGLVDIKTGKTIGLIVERTG